ncbi:TFIIH/NER complex subunit [Coemansia sp. RSA 989]|nr:TFIIH/NER complex subunit [Coemansia sp. RSA 1821]KAJ1865978.1 TFIIH/NER complex subunit [Coemansia sp. RSA 989]KAJ1873140.1 TFIIH/NER complex subunit [Coemansia sp. RSA 990]KAJ2631836.1 TFIIH/NER complex subunit [Coemansia sp. RSA 1290]KAJ2674854.1 TFIIH/NER complex subunit [Coemansia sp. RSA 1085]
MDIMEVFAPAYNQSIPAFSSDVDICPQCKSQRYLNKHMKLLVSPCYHKMCADCVNNRFNTGPAPCPECQRTLRKNDFYRPVFEDLTVENEVRIRQQMAQIFNKREEDFKTLKDYNAYLEMVEDLILKRLDGVESEEVDSQIEKYAKENQKSISRNKKKSQQEEKLQQILSHQERTKRKKQLEEYERELEEERRSKEEARNSLINELASSDKDVQEIVKKGMIQLKQSSLRTRGATRKMEVDVEALLGTIDEEFGEDMEEEQVDAGPFDPSESPYAPIQIELRERYEDPNPAFRQGTLAAAGVTREMHQRYLLEGAMSGLFALPPESTD